VKHVIFTEEAARDLEEASTWFDEHSGIGGTGFLALIDEAVKNICDTPFAAPPWSYAPEFRARTLRRLPLSRDLRSHERADPDHRDRPHESRSRALGRPRQVILY